MRLQGDHNGYSYRATVSNVINLRYWVTGECACKAVITNLPYEGGDVKEQIHGFINALGMGVIA